MENHIQFIQDWEYAGASDIGTRTMRGTPTRLDAQKVLFLSTFGVSNRHFDRHDWYVVVNEETGIEKRYVLEIYMQQQQQQQ